jgi:hypothetical protein
VRVIYKTLFGRKNVSAEKVISAKKDISAEISFRSEYLSAEKMLPDEKNPVWLKLYMKIEGIVMVPFDLMFKGSAETYFGRKNRTFGRKKILVRPKKGLSEFWRSDSHESVTHLHEFTLLSPISRDN